MCGSKSTSREHVPPRCLFPELKDPPIGFDFRKNLISFPSCDLHNSEKAQDDEYLMFLLATALRGNEHKATHFETKVMRAIRRKPKVYRALMKDLTPVTVAAKNGETIPTVAFAVDVDRFNKCMQHIACGIFFHHTGTRWAKQIRVVTDAFAMLRGPNATETNRLLQDGTRLLAEAFSTVPVEGQNLPIFQYRLHKTDEGVHAIFMTFYEGIRVSALFSDTGPPR